MTSGLQWHKSDGVETATQAGFTYELKEVSDGKSMLQLFTISIQFTGQTLCDLCDDSLHSLDTAKLFCESHALSVSKAVEGKLQINVEECVNELYSHLKNKLGAQLIIGGVFIQLAFEDIILKHLNATPSIGGKE